MAFEQAEALCEAIDAALNKLDALDKDPLTHAERLVLSERRETWRRRLPAGEQVRIIRESFSPRCPAGSTTPPRPKPSRSWPRSPRPTGPISCNALPTGMKPCFNPDGEFTNEHRARRRGVTLGPQGADGMSRLTGWLDLELRAGLDLEFRS